MHKNGGFIQKKLQDFKPRTKMSHFFCLLHTQILSSLQRAENNRSAASSAHNRRKLLRCHKYLFLARCPMVVVQGGLLCVKVTSECCRCVLLFVFMLSWMYACVHTRSYLHNKSPTFAEHHLCSSCTSNLAFPSVHHILHKSNLTFHFCMCHPIPRGWKIQQSTRCLFLTPKFPQSVQVIRGRKQTVSSLPYFPAGSLSWREQREENGMTMLNISCFPLGDSVR